jgi:GWxTD domain-containing protein
MKTFIISIISALTLINSPAQVGKSSKDMFSLDALNFFSPDSTKTRLDVYIEIPFSKVEFKKYKNSSEFGSEFDITLSIKDENNSPVIDKVYKEELKTDKTDAEFLSQNSRIIIKNFYLTPGQYKLKVSLYELSTKKYYEKDHNITVRDFLMLPLTISDVMIVSRLVYSKDRKFITPDVSRNVGSLDTFYLFFFVYKNCEANDIDVVCKIQDANKDEVFSAKESIDIQNQIIMPVPAEKFPFGKYNIVISAGTPDYKTQLKSDFENENKDFPVDLTNLDLLVDQLQYVAKDDELSKIRDAKTDAEKLRLYLEFWKSKDPTPSTKRNEALIMYYQRINYANEHFSTSYTDGWRSDMGMVYIIFGQPNNIERHPYDPDNKPYEIWDYYENNRQFIFVDNTGFGDYRLITPIWDTFRFNN